MIKNYFILIIICFSIPFAMGENIDYSIVKYENTDLYIIPFNPKKNRIKIVKSFNKLAGKDYLSKLAKNSLIGINGGFFHPNGKPVGLLKIKNRLFTLGRRLQSVFGFNSDGSIMIIDQIRPDIKFFIDTKEIYIQRFNDFTRGNEVILFTDVFGESTLTDGERKEIIINDKQEIISINIGGGNNIKPNYMIISVAKNFDTSFYKIGQKVSFEIIYDTSDKSNAIWNNVEYIITGIPLLIKNNHINYRALQALRKKFSDDSHARSAVCITNDNNILFVVSHYKKYEGMSLRKFAEFLKIQNCRDALNLDGGGSSGFVYKEKLINKIFKERKISNAIVIDHL